MKHIQSYRLFERSSIDEYKKFEDFPGALRFGDWTKFAEALKSTIDKGFTTIDELLDGLGLDKSLYEKIKYNMVDNWIDSVSKSLLHGISGVDLEVPEAGDVIFKNADAQTRFLIVAGPGHSSMNMFRETNTTKGIGMWGMPSLKEVKSGKSPFRISNEPLTLVDTKQDKLNEVLQYVWVYVFFNDYIAKKQKVKLPKVLYRGIRMSNVFDYPGIKAELSKLKYEDSGEFYYANNTKKRMDAIVDYIVKNGISGITEGNYLSFTGSLAVAEYFANNSGFVIKVDPSKVRVVASPLTDEAFAEPNPVTGKKEQEYIVMVPDEYKFTKGDIVISNEDYFIADNSPLAVQYFSHDDKKADYDIEFEGKTYHIEAWYAWSSNTKGGLTFKIDGSWQDGIRQIRKDYGFDPTPTEKNLDKISNFKISKRKSW